MKAKLKSHRWPIYEQKPILSWECPMCTFRVYPDLDSEYVKKTVESHLREHHFVTTDIELVIKEAK